MAAIQRTTKQQILDAAQDLHNAEQMVTREALREITGLTLTINDVTFGRLPDRARKVLMDAAAVGEPGSFERRMSIDAATEAARLRWPAYFVHEAADKC